VLIERTHFDANDCSSNGGAMAASDGIALKLGNVTFANNIAAMYGGGLSVASNVFLETHGVSYYNNSAGVGGGGLALEYSSVAQIQGGVARGNAAWGPGSGGGAFLFQYGTNVEMADMVATDNYALYAGGAIFFFDVYTATLVNITAIGNAVGTLGGGVCLLFVDSARIAESQFSDDSGRWGGGLMVLFADLIVLEQLQFADCSVLEFGGGIHMYEVYKLVIQRVGFERCSTGADHGAATIRNCPGLKLFDSTFAESSAVGLAGGLYLGATYAMDSVANITNVVFRRNSAGSCGAINIDNTAAVLTNVTAIGNRATSADGGAMCIGQIGAPASVALLGGAIDHNVAMVGAGGGVAIADDNSALSAAWTCISHNDAWEGGGIAITDDATAAVVLRDDVMLNHNTAANDGGAVSIGNGGGALRIIGDVAMNANKANGDGGALHLGKGSSLESFNGCQSITLNAVTSTGEWSAAPWVGWLVLAAVDSDDGSVLASCCIDELGRTTRVGRDTILSETSTGTYAMTACLRPGSYTASFENPYGGNVDQTYGNFKPVLLDAATSVDGEVLFSQTSVPAKFRIRAGGGVLSLTNNSAGLDGGGMWIGTGARAETVGLVVSGNRAFRDGGGVHVDQGVIEVLRGQMDANIAGRNGGGLSLGLFSTATVNSTRCVGNVASSGDGGGIAATKYAQLVAGDSELKDNTAGLDGGGCALSEMPGTISTLVNCTVAHNTARNGFGGGLCARDAGLKLEATRLVSNEALAGSGGGVASVAQADSSTTLTTFEARGGTGCVPVEIHLDWLSVKGGCEVFQESPAFYHTCESTNFQSCSAAYEGATSSGTLYRDNCTGCPCNNIFLDAVDYETFATIVDADATWDGWSFAFAYDADGKETFALPNAKGLVVEHFCLAAGDYVFASLDKMTIPHTQPWWGGKYRLIVDGEVLAHAALASVAEFVNFTIVNKTTTLPVAFDANQAPSGGGGAVFWDMAAPEGLAETETTCFDDSNAALYGDQWATDAMALSCVADRRRLAVVTALSGRPMFSPLSVELLDRYGQRVNSDDASVVLAELVDDVATNATLVGPLAICKQGLATFADLVIYAEPEISVQLKLSTTSLAIPSIAVDISLNACPAGMVEQETLQGNTYCAECEPSMFEHEGVCVNCIKGLNCDNAESRVPLSKLAVLPGYWRHLENSFDLFKCPLEEACVGTVSTEARRRLVDTSGLCEHGYSGVLCSCCQTGFVLNLGRCEECASMSYTNLIICAIFSIVVALLLVYLSRSRRFAAAMESITLGVEFKVNVPCVANQN
jgi:hypothetical protein